MEGIVGGLCFFLFPFLVVGSVIFFFGGAEGVKFLLIVIYCVLDFDISGSAR